MPRLSTSSAGRPHPATRALEPQAVRPCLLATPTIAQEIAHPNLILKAVVQSMPKGAQQEVKILTGTIQPDDKAPFHTYPFPVTVYILEGTCILEIEGRSPVVLKAGESFVEPPHAKMTGYNKSATEPMRAVTFYVSDADAPFLDLVH